MVGVGTVRVAELQYQRNRLEEHNDILRARQVQFASTLESASHCLTMLQQDKIVMCTHAELVAMMLKVTKYACMTESVQ